MILLRLLDHDLHRTRANLQALPLWIEIPAKPSFLPAVISSSSMDVPERRFLVSRRLTQDDKIRCGIFKYDSDRIDDIIGDLLRAAYGLSFQEKWPNIFRGKNKIKAAFTYVQNSSGMKSQPHICLIPEDSSLDKFDKLAGKDVKDGVYNKMCSITPCKVPFPIFCSRPDFVGMYTQFVGGRSSLLLHNVKSGLAFCPPDEI